MGNLARRDQYALPITGGLEQQALANRHRAAGPT
jgi:hypothetical protein